MRIKELHLENFRGFEKLDIVFPEDSNVAVFIGENGSGKTTILDAVGKLIEGVLLTNYFFAHRNNVIGNVIKFAKTDIKNNCEQWLLSGNVKDINSGNIFPFTFNDIRNTIHFIHEESKGSMNIHLLGAYQNKEIHKLEWFEMPEDENSRKRKMYEKREILEQVYSDALAINLSSIKNIFNTFNTWFLESESIENQMRLDEDNTYRLPELEDFRYIIKTFYNNLNDVRFDNLKGNRQKSAKIFEKTNPYIELTKGNETLRLDQLSSGELTLLMLVTDMTRRLLLMTEEPTIEKITKSEGIILIDEIDLHLHPKWQRNIIPALTKTFPNVQFIVTTHSPQVLSYVPNGSVFAVENGQAIPVNSYGQDSNSLLWKIFNTTEHPKFTSDLIADCAKLIENEQYEAAQKVLTELTQILGFDDTHVIQLKTELDFYLQESE